MSPRAETAPRRRGGRVALGAAGLELALAAALAAALGVFHVWTHTRVVSAGYALYELQQEHARLVAARDQLEIERGMLTSFQALDKAARGGAQVARLGLAPPDRGAVWAAGPDRAAAVPARAGVGGVDHRPRPAGPIVGAGEGVGRAVAGPRVALGVAAAGARGP